MHGQAELLRLRYRLLWAQVRLRRGKIALFLIGYLLAGFFTALLLLGGFGAAMASIRLGKAELVARIVLVGFSSIAILAALVLGIGVNPAFSDAVLRRYPLSEADRFFTRRLTAFLDPLWMILLALFLGLAIGFGAAGAGSAWTAVPAALLLTLATYFFAQLLAAWIEWIVATPAGLTILVVLALILVFAISAAPAMAANKNLAAATLAVMRFTPAFCAAAVMAGGSAIGLLLLLMWCAAMATAVAGIERLPVPSRAATGAQAEWGGAADRVAERFGSTAPLIAKTLKYYWRNKRSRIGLLTSVPCFLLAMVAIRPHPREPMLHFFLGMGIMAIAGYAATFVMSVNCFGFDGPGFRRYFLLPVPPAVVVRAASVVPLLMGAAMLPVAFAVCVLQAHVRVDARMAAMLAASGAGGLCFFHALALWTSVLWPSRTDGAVKFGNDYSFAANVTGNVGMLIVFFGSQALGFLPGARTLRFWWAAPVFMAASSVFYAVTLRLAPAVLVSHRERILAVVEREQGPIGRLIT